MTPRTLDAYPRPGLAVDVAVLSVQSPVDQEGPTQRPGALVALVQQRTSTPRGPVLPGRFVRERQTLAQAVHDVLEIKVGITTERLPRLLELLDDPDRDERGWIVSAAHTLVLPPSGTGAALGSWVPVDENGRLASGERLVFDHERILSSAVRRLRDRYERRPDPDHLLGDAFTLGELRAAHEAVLGAPLHRDTFNRRMLDHLEEVSRGGEVLTRSSGGRPARTYRRRTRRDLSPAETRRTRLPRRT